MGPALWNLTDEALDDCPWLRLRFRTVGIVGGFNYDQSFDLSKACPTCGAGAEPRPTLVANLTDMRKKLIAHTAHEGQIVVLKEVADALSQAKLTGFSLQPVLHFANHIPDARYCWLRIDSVWPRMHPKRILAIEDPCPTCARAGHFDTYEVRPEFWYHEQPANACDFNFTWEFFGVWRHPLSKRPSPIGGMRMPIVSQKVRRLFADYGMKRLSYEPVFFESKPA